MGRWTSRTRQGGGAGGGGGETLAGTLLLGNSTGGTNLIVSTGDALLGAAELTLDAVTAITIGAATATSIQVGQAGVTTTFPGTTDATITDGVLSLALGTAALPGLTGADATTGLQLGTSRVDLSTGGSTRFIVTLSNIDCRLPIQLGGRDIIQIGTLNFNAAQDTFLAAATPGTVTLGTTDGGTDGVLDISGAGTETTLKLGLGQGSTPAIVFGDPNSGIHAQNAGQAIVLTSNGVSVFYADSSLSALGSNARVNDNLSWLYGTGSDAAMLWDTGQTNHAWQWSPGDVSNTILIVDNTHLAVDYGHANQSDPTTFWHANSATTALWGSLAHNGTDFVLSSGGGDLKLAPAGDITFGTRFLQGEEMSDPAAPAANKGRLYFRDNGGKTELVARFPTGAIQQVAIEP